MLKSEWMIWAIFCIFVCVFCFVLATVRWGNLLKLLVGPCGWTCGCQLEQILSSGMCTNRWLKVRQSCGSKLQLTAKDATTVALTVSGWHLILWRVFYCTANAWTRMQINGPIAAVIGCVGLQAFRCSCQWTVRKLCVAAVKAFSIESNGINHRRGGGIVVNLLSIIINLMPPILVIFNLHVNLSTAVFFFFFLAECVDLGLQRSLERTLQLVIALAAIGDAPTPWLISTNMPYTIH